MNKAKDFSESITVAIISIKGFAKYLLLLTAIITFFPVGTGLRLFFGLSFR